MTLIDQLDEVAERLAETKDRDTYELAQILRKAIHNVDMAQNQITVHFLALEARLNVLEND